MRQLKSWLDRIPLWLPLLIVVGGLYGRSVNFEFVFWDDAPLIYGNQFVNTTSPYALAVAWKAPHEGMYIPLVYNLWWGLAHLGRMTPGSAAQQGLNAWPFHMANVTVHWINGCLVLAILLRIGLRRWAAFFGATIFLIHPLQIEAACWSTGMKDLLSNGLALGGICAYLRAADDWRTGKRVKAHFAYSASLLLITLGSLAKPGIIGAPLIAGMLDMLFISGLSRGVVIRIALLTAVVLPSAFWTSMAQPVAYAPGIDLAMRPAIAAHALGFYIQKLFVPARLCLDYGLRPILVLTQWRHVALGLLVPGLLLLLLLARSHRKMLAAAEMAFALGVAPVLGLVPFGFQFWSTVADRYVYLSMLGTAIAAAYLIALVPRRSAIPAACAIVAGLGIVSWRQSSVWHDTIALMDHCIRVNPRSAAAYNNFTSAFCPTPALSAYLDATHSPATRPTGFLNPKASAELYALADRYFTKAFLLRPEYPDPLKNLITSLAGRGHYQDALDLCLIAVHNPRYDVFQFLVEPYQLGWLYWQVGRNAEAASLFRLALLRDPRHVGAREGLARIAEGKPATLPTSPPPAAKQ